MPTQRKSAKSSKKSSGKSSGSSSRSSQSRSSARSRTGSAGSGSSSRPASRKSQSSRGGSQGRSGGASTKRSTGTRSKAPNALELLTEDHRNVQKMFRKAERLESGDRQLKEIVETTCAALTLHAQIEEQIFYPAIRKQSDKQDLVQEALVEHDSAKQLIAQLQALGPRDERYKATFKVLGEYVNHHIEEEESSMFRAARRAKIDLEALGQQILMAKEGGVTAEAEASAQSSRGDSARSSRRSSGSANSSGDSASRSSRSSRSRQSGASDSQERGEEGSQAALDDETESGTMAGRTGGDSSEGSERPGRGGRHASSSMEDADEGGEIDVETPGGSSRHDTH